jgi:hypothetical protein
VAKHKGIKIYQPTGSDCHAENTSPCEAIVMCRVVTGTLPEVTRQIDLVLATPRRPLRPGVVDPR